MIKNTKLNQALIAHQNGDIALASQLYQEVLEANPKLASGWHLLGVLLYQTANYPQAEQTLKKAVKLEKNHNYYYHLGHAQKAQSKHFEAEQSYQAGLAINPENIDLSVSLSQLYSQTNQPEKAIQLLLNLSPAQPSTKILFHLGFAYVVNHQFDEAVESYLEALNIETNWELWSHLANVYQIKHSWDKAIAAYQEAIKLNPGHSPTLNSLGFIYSKNKQLGKALDYYHQALEGELNADYFNNLANALTELGCTNEAIKAYRHALTLDPNAAYIHSNLLGAMCAEASVNSEEHFKEAQIWSKTHIHSLQSPPVFHLHDPEKVLKIGYLSPEFKYGSAAQFYIQIFKHHNPNSFKIIALSELHEADKTTEQFQALVHDWINTAHLSDEELAIKIRSLGIDILVDLAGHAEGHRLGVFSYHPAPITLTGLAGYTSGLNQIDYRLSDPAISPLKQIKYSSEKVTYYTPTVMNWLPPTFKLEIVDFPAIENGFLTFGCGNGLFKVNAEIIKIWSDILKQVPHSKLHLKNPYFDEDRTRAYYIQQFALNEIPENRLLFSGSTSHKEHLKFYQLIDIALDPFPSTGGVTTCEALWMGRPVIGLEGGSGATTSILQAIQLEQLIGSDAEDYIQLAVTLAQQICLELMDAKPFRSQLLESPICNGQLQTLHLENLYRILWRNFLTKNGKRLSKK